MARRKSLQRGNLQWHNGCRTLRYREKDHRTGKWVMKRERLDSFADPKQKKAARKAADLFIAGVDIRNNSTTHRKSNRPGRRPPSSSPGAGGRTP